MLSGGRRASAQQGGSQGADRDGGRVSLRTAANAVVAANRIARRARTPTLGTDSQGADREEGRVSLRTAATAVVAMNRLANGGRTTTEV